MDAGEIITLPASAQPQVSILIPTRSQARLLGLCLKSLCHHIGPSISYEVIIVLNAATDEVKSFVRNCVKGAVILESQANLGVAGGYNLARSAARGSSLVLLHDDTEIQPDWLESLLSTLEKNPVAGAVGSFQFHPDGRPQRAGSILWQDGRTSPAWGEGEPAESLYSEIRPVDYIGTCSSLVRTSVWDAIGGMDERIYPAYFVDVDLCMLIHRLGRTVLCDPHSRIFHHGSSSTAKDFRDFIYRENRARFRKKWAAELALCEPRAPHDPAAIARADQLTARRADKLAAAWNAAPEPLCNLPPFNARRQQQRHFQKELELLTAYQAHIGSDDSALAAEIATLRNRCAMIQPVHQPRRRSILGRLLSAFKRRAN